VSIKTSIQQSIILRPGQKAHMKQRKNRSFISLNNAVTIGIIARCHDQHTLEILSDFYAQLRREECNYRILLIIDKKQDIVNHYDYEKLFPGAILTLICINDYTFMGVPKKKVFAPFISSDFDLIFRIGLGASFELDTILLSTRARMYAGHDHPELPFIDFRITLEQDADLAALTRNLLIYMAKLDQDSTNKADSHTNDYRLF
jgi:hypothetical protein